MHEAIQAAMGFGFKSLGLHSIEACIHPENIGSREILKKNGFVKEAYFREDIYYEGEFMDTEIYGLLEKDFVS
jgi:[ribosomal protein S5]-alanine N-acetyltransferase